MGILGQRKPGAAPPAIRVEKVVVSQKPKPAAPSSSTTNNNRVNGSLSSKKKTSPSLSASSSSSTAATTARRPSPHLSTNASHNNNRIPRPKSASPYPSSSDERRKRKAPASAVAAASSGTPRDSPAFGNDSDSDGDSDDDPFATTRPKRMRLSDSRSIDTNRRLRHKRAFGEDIREPRIIHGADIASVRNKSSPFPGARKDEVAVRLQYPSRCRRERYELVSGKDHLDPIKEILAVVRLVAEAYLTDEQAKEFTSPIKSYTRRLERASSNQYRDVTEFKKALTDYNKALFKLVESGSVAKNLDQIHHLPSDLVSFLLGQVYDRTVSPKAEILNKYEMGSDNVYGELLHPFISKILVDHTNMTSDQTFVDLGSGVGNVCLQAALEIGCRSIGCEMMENACNLAEAQEQEFRARCLQWGIAPGRVYLERGDFRTNKRILDVLKEADVILVNNKAFTSVLNDALINMFLDLKKGCKIVSLKSFVHENSAAVNDVANTILDVQHYRYHENWVSWAATEGDYYISTRK